MAAITKIRRVLALVAVVCFFLPLGQCTRLRWDSAQVHENGRIQTAEPKTITDVLVPAGKIRLPPVTFDDIAFDVLLVSAFFWPLLAVAIEGRAKTGAVRNLLNGAELLASAGTLYLLYGLLFFKQVLPAGYVAVAMFVVLFLLSVVRGAQTVRAWLDRRRPRPSRTQGQMK